MADAAHSGNAGVHSSSCGYWSDFAWQELVADPVSSAEMVSSFATDSRPVHRDRAAPGTLLEPRALTSAAMERACVSCRGQRPRLQPRIVHGDEISIVHTCVACHSKSSS